MGSARSTRKRKTTQTPTKRRLSEFRGMFPVTKPYIGVEATREEVGRKLGEELDRKIRKP
jgi:hypothetical protein